MTNIDLIALGKHMRASANDREGLPEDSMPSVPAVESWHFIQDNAGEDSEEYFGVHVPESGTPDFPPHAFILGYYSPLAADQVAIDDGIAAYMTGNPAAATIRP